MKMAVFIKPLELKLQVRCFHFSFYCIVCEAKVQGFQFCQGVSYMQSRPDPCWQNHDLTPCGM